jgi:hypothetical protein
MFAVYIPSWSGAVAQLPMQFALIVLLAVAIYAYSIQRHKARVVLSGLSLGFVAGLVGGLCYAWTSQGFNEFNTIAFFELHQFQVAEFLGLVASWLLLEAVSYGWHKRFAKQNSGEV